MKGVAVSTRCQERCGVLVMNYTAMTHSQMSFSSSDHGRGISPHPGAWGPEKSVIA